MGLVTVGSVGGGLPLVSMTAKAWSGWNMVFNAFKSVGRESLRSDIVTRGSYRRGKDNAFFEALVGIDIRRGTSRVGLIRRR
jgi:hypothetical protein